MSRRSLAIVTGTTLAAYIGSIAAVVWPTRA